MLAELQKEADASLGRTSAEGAPVGDTPVACTLYEPNHAWEPHPFRPEPLDLPAVTLPPPLLAPVAPGTEVVDPRLAERSRIPPQRVWRVVPDVRRPSAPAWVVGSLVHESLAAWRFPDGASDAAFERWGRARARGYGLADPRELADAVSRTRALLQRFREHSLYGEMDTAERRLHEVPYSLEVDGRVESGILDALYLPTGAPPAGAWTLVEFKTDRLQDEAGLDRLLAGEDYLAQARRYQAAAECLLGAWPRAVLCLLNYAGGVRPVTVPEVGG
jgi:hypothetical protein